MEYPRGVRLWRTCQADRSDTKQAYPHRGVPFAHESNNLKPIKFLRAKRVAIDDGRAELQAQHALEREVDAWETSCRIMFMMQISG